MGEQVFVFRNFMGRRRRVLMSAEDTAEHRARWRAWSREKDVRRKQARAAVKRAGTDSRAVADAIEKAVLD